jgi:hypothetical protein
MAQSGGEYRYILAADCIYQTLPGEDTGEDTGRDIGEGGGEPQGSPMGGVPSVSGCLIDWRVVALLETLSALSGLASGKGGKTQVLLSTQRRGSGKDIDDFFRLAKEKGFRVERVDCDRHIASMMLKASRYPGMLVNIARCELYTMQVADTSGKQAGNGEAGAE